MAAEAGLEKQLRSRAAEVIAGVKAYDVPGLCARLGLASGDEDEAMRSKFKYAHSRLMNVPAENLLPIAKALLAEEADFALAELTAKIGERGTTTCRTGCQPRWVDGNLPRRNVGSQKIRLIRYAKLPAVKSGHRNNGCN